MIKRFMSKDELDADMDAGAAAGFFVSALVTALTFIVDMPWKAFFLTGIFIAIGSLLFVKAVRRWMYDVDERLEEAKGEGGLEWDNDG